MRPRTLVVVAALALGLAGSPGAPRPPRSPSSTEPRLVLWAWERPERLEFIDPQRVAVAFLAKTLTLRGDGLVATSRRQPLFVPPGTQLIAVVRIETRRSRPASLGVEQESLVARELLNAVEQTGVSALQIDFDASTSERAFYRRLLARLRPSLPAGARLSITALASWCLDDPWIASAPIDMAVPMLFRMGSEANRIRRRIEAGADFSLPLCRSRVGVSTDEPWVRYSGQYWVFSPRAWTKTTVAAALWTVEEWSGQ